MEALSDSGFTSGLSQSRRDRRIVQGLIGLLFLGMILYLTITLNRTNSTQVGLATIRNENTARLCARLLERRCQNAFHALNVLVHRKKVESLVQRADRPQLSQMLQDTVDLLPDLVAAAAYTRDGKLLSCFPSQLSLPSDGTKTPWFAHLRKRLSTSQNSLVSDVVQVPLPTKEEAILIVMPVQAIDGPSHGYILAFFRLGNFYDWLQSIRFYGGTVMILDSTGRIITTSGDATLGPRSYSEQFRKRRIATDYVPYLQARQGKQGAGPYALPTLQGLPEEQQVGEGKGGQMVGYALAPLPGWVVLVVQPTEAAFAPYRNLLQGFAIIGIPLLLAVPLVGWNLYLLYERLQRLAFALGQRNILLNQLNHAKSDLLANVSHDLKTPIASMQISVSGLLETEWDADAVPKLDPQVAECLTLVSQELDTLAGRVRNLLDMSRLDSDSTVLLREPCDLTDIVASALERVRPLQRKRVILTDFPPTPLLVMCDPSELETVVLNLLENALKYTPPELPLTLEGRHDGQEIVLRVIDQGEGIPPGEEERVFEKFYRAGTTTAAGGTGLGLAICRTILEAHGGQIHAERSPSGGAQFTVTLPLCDMSTGSLVEVEPPKERV